MNMHKPIALLLLLSSALCGCEQLAFADATNIATRARTRASTNAARASVAVQTPLQVLGSAAIAVEYDPARGFTLVGSDIDTLACQKSGHVVSAPAAGNRPAYTASDADFGGKPSFTTSEAGADGMYSASAHGSDLIASGASPYVAWLGKISAPSANTRRIYTLYSAASLTNPVTVLRVATTGVLQQIWNAGTTDLNTPGTAVHLHEWLYDGSGNLEHYQDGVLDEENVTAALTSEVRRVAFGIRGDNTGPCDAEHAYLLVTHSAVSAGQRAALSPFWRARGAPL